jgi:TonB family protein
MLKEKIVLLHGFHRGKTLHYDANGKLLDQVNNGYWSSDGMVQISDARVEKNLTLVVKGFRIVSKFDEDTGKFVNLKTKVPIKLLISLDPSWQDSAPVQRLLAKVFATDFDTTLAGVLPEYWNCWVSGKVTRDKRFGWKCSSNDSQVKNENLAKVYTIGEDIKPPRVLSQEEPHFTELAREAKVQGIVVLSVIVDEFGNPHLTGIARPLGAGLDDVAIENLRNWHFSPATRNGEPVAVSVNMEVSFRLY